jgi:hypothetical protein
MRTSDHGAPYLHTFDAGGPEAVGSFMVVRTPLDLGRSIPLTSLSGNGLCHAVLVVTHYIILSARNTY